MRWHVGNCGKPSLHVEYARRQSVASAEPRKTWKRRLQVTEDGGSSQQKIIFGIFAFHSFPPFSSSEASNPLKMCVCIYIYICILYMGVLVPMAAATGPMKAAAEWRSGGHWRMFRGSVKWASAFWGIVLRRRQIQHCPIRTYNPCLELIPKAVWSTQLLSIGQHFIPDLATAPYSGNFEAVISVRREQGYERHVT